MDCPTKKNLYNIKFLTEMSLIDIHINRNFPTDQGTLNVYQCEFCGACHLTSKSSKRNEQLQ